VVGREQAPSDLVATISTILGASGDDRLRLLVEAADRGGLSGILWQRPDDSCNHVNLGGMLVCLKCFVVAIF
jgi:hypothetical protein